MNTPFTDIARRCAAVLVSHDAGMRELDDARAGLDYRDRNEAREAEENARIKMRVEQRLQKIIVEGLP